MGQYTIRNVPAIVDRQLRELARRRGVSLNDAVLEAIRQGLGIGEIAVEHHDLDDLIGSWKEDPEFDAAITDQDTVDPDLWR